MATCEQCKHFFVHEQDEARGDCVRRVVDPRQGYYTARPVDAGSDASTCDGFSGR